ncbi:hypothetical protein LCGC14_0018850 [marine sediment metagenome]|uniref:Beta-lactamase class A catalytic domain-containing protein n=1 Tax=marine sediment metagenome TaxID=412755 RepID=A0A0F9Z2R5_9ZZZZ|nr:hypothetical protein [Phycisphaerae bacterium]HDZ44902.1 hypothetical protein [Phycisphaerae bacterium]
MRGNAMTWRHWLVGIVCCVLLTTAIPADEPSQDTAALDGRAADVRAMIVAKPAEFEGAFSESFLNQVPAEALEEIGSGYFEEYGAVIDVRPVAVESSFQGKFDFITDKGYSFPVHLVIEGQPPHQIIGLNFGMGAPLMASLDEVVAALEKLPGTASLCVTRYGDDGPEQLAALNVDATLAIGSAFKLYVLAELVRATNAGERQWADVITLDAKIITLPTGILQDWPAGTPMTLQALATLMISVSDNTATDHLIHALGREKVEAILASTGHHQPDRNAPLLTTLELCKLKAGPDSELTDRYLSGDQQARRALLADDVAAMSRDDVRLELLAGTPRYVNELEWFASTADLARALIWLRDHSTPDDAGAPARDILAVNPGLPPAAGQWDYWGYKGGSEVGVLNLSFLLKRTDGAWFTVVGTWNNPDSALDDGKFMGLIEAALRLLGEADQQADE